MGTDIIAEMLLYIARHANANQGYDDNSRVLSPQGIQDAKKIRNFLDERKISFDYCVSSPLIRASQTLDILRGNCQSETLEALRPGASPTKFMSVIPKDNTNVLLVGHMPDVGRFVSFLISGGTLELQIGMSTCSIACVQVEKLPLTSPGNLLWLVSPESV